jgi:hypothetical protein
MPTESRATSAVAALSVVVAVVGHVLAGGMAPPLWMVSPLLALTAVCWLLGEYLAGERLLSMLVLACIQLFVHVTLDAVHPAGGMHDAAMSSGLAGSVWMAAAHLSVLLAGVAVLGRVHRFLSRVVRLVARLLPVLPVLGAVPALRPVFVVPPVPPRFSGAGLSSCVSLRGPPGVRAIAAV